MTEEIKMEKVESSSLEAYGWSTKSNIMRVRFKGGAEYDYEPVPAVLWTQFRTAESKGKFFFKNIRHNKNIVCKKIKDKDNADV